MASRPRWTKEEDEILVQAIKANPHNKTQVFRELEQQLNRSSTAISYRWYYALSNPESPHYVGCLFTMIGHSSRLYNRTIETTTTKVSPTPNRRGLWSKIKKLLGLK